VRGELRDIELKILSELMKNSRISDRELARKLGVSQPTVTRIRHKLDEEGYIREFTVIPDLAKLGYSIMALTFVKLGKTTSSEDVEKAREIAKESLKKGPFEIVMLERGIGLNHSGLAISVHRDYSSYRRFIAWINQFTFLDIERTESFLIDLNDKVRYRPLTFRTLAEHLLAREEKEQK
jgi:DNA-binding Lrp family transcriptional regulator